MEHAEFARRMRQIEARLDGVAEELEEARDFFRTLWYDLRGEWSLERDGPMPQHVPQSSLPDQ